MLLNEFLVAEQTNPNILESNPKNKNQKQNQRKVTPKP